MTDIGVLIVCPDAGPAGDAAEAATRLDTALRDRGCRVELRIPLGPTRGGQHTREGAEGFKPSALPGKSRLFSSLNQLVFLTRLGPFIKLEPETGFAPALLGSKPRVLSVGRLRHGCGRRNRTALTGL